MDYTCVVSQYCLHLLMPPSHLAMRRCDTQQALISSDHIVIQSCASWQRLVASDSNCSEVVVKVALSQQERINTIVLSHAERAMCPPHLPLSLDMHGFKKRNR